VMTRITTTQADADKNSRVASELRRMMPLVSRF
jgi:hypothetical protein